MTVSSKALPAGRSNPRSCLGSTLPGLRIDQLLDPGLEVLLPMRPWLILLVTAD